MGGDPLDRYGGKNELIVIREHQPNASSGGQTTQIEIGDFLMHGGHGPEHQALLRLIGTLVEEPAPA
ncbi:MAG TPA: hypothetical protein VN083_05375 [Vicinamibacteria bacterium]|nr:hypothetical protein [Vicinamibacteria bacterium]